MHADLVNQHASADQRADDAGRESRRPAGGRAQRASIVGNLDRPLDARLERGRGPRVWLGERDVEAHTAYRPLQLSWCSLRDHATLVDDYDAVREGVRFVKVLGGE